MRRVILYSHCRLMAVTISAFFTFNAVSQPSYAQVVKGKPLQKFAPEYWSKTKRHENFYDMKEPEDLPGLPSYPGKTKFLNGIMEPGKNDQKHYQMCFASKDPPKQIMDWYISTLQENSWNIITSSSSSLVARDSNNSLCTISIGAFNQVIDRQKYQSRLTILYRLVPKQTN